MQASADVKRVGVAIQASYTFYITPTGVLTCDDIINIPLAKVINRTINMNSANINILPVVELKMPEENFNVKIVTNEGMVIEPLNRGNFVFSGDSFKNSLYFVLPNGTNSIKGVSIKAGEKKLKVSLEFGIMSPPYSYDSVIFAQISDIVNFLTGEVVKLNNANTALDGRVDALESKTDNLKIVTHALNASFPYKELPKNSGKQTVNIEKGMLYFWANFTYISGGSSSHSPKITVSDGSITTACTLSLDDSVTVTIDLLAGTITAYVRSTGKIVQQLKIFNTVIGYKTIAFEDFDDIADNTLTVLITGRGVE